MSNDFSHLSACITRLANERARLDAATCPHERELRAVWVRQAEKEVNGEERFLGLPETDYSQPEMTTDEILAELDL